MKGNLFRLPFVCLKCFHICTILLKSLFTGLIGCFFFIRVFQHINFLNTHLSVGGYRYGKRDIQIRLRIADTRCIYKALRSCFIIYDSFRARTLPGVRHPLPRKIILGEGLVEHWFTAARQTQHDFIIHIRIPHFIGNMRQALVRCTGNERTIILPFEFDVYFTFRSLHPLYSTASTLSCVANTDSFFEFTLPPQAVTATTSGNKSR